MTDSKRCIACGQSLPVTEFGPNANNPGTLKARCRACLRVYMRAARATGRYAAREDAYNKARRRAISRLIAAFPDSFAEFLEEAFATERADSHAD